MKKERKDTSGIELSTICRQLKLRLQMAKNEKLIVQIQKAYFVLFNQFLHLKQNRLKLWLAKIGKERIDEIENPELGMERVKSFMKKKDMKKVGLINECVDVSSS